MKIISSSRNIVFKDLSAERRNITARVIDMNDDFLSNGIVKLSLQNLDQVHLAALPYYASMQVHGFVGLKKIQTGRCLLPCFLVN